jgi:hypothetical protein
VAGHTLIELQSGRLRWPQPASIDSLLRGKRFSAKCVVLYHTDFRQDVLGQTARPYYPAEVSQGLIERFKARWLSVPQRM